MGNLSLGAFAVALSGMAIVFIMLAVLCHMIPIISKIVQATQKSNAAVQSVAATTHAAPSAAPASTATTGDVALIDVDEKTAACIMAIVSHESGIPLSALIFKTIKAI